LVLALLTGPLAGCGLKGPLTLPERGGGEVVIRDPAKPPAQTTPPASTPDPTP
jgi:predicted small lipoprotein YifL